MVKKEINLQVENSQGLHCRAAVKLMKTATDYDALVELLYNDCVADCSSILDILSLACSKGETVTVRASGPQADAVLRAIKKVFDERFGEE